MGVGWRRAHVGCVGPGDHRVLSLPLAGGPVFSTLAPSSRAPCWRERRPAAKRRRACGTSSLNDGTRRGWAPERVQRNALKVAQDDSAVAYVGNQSGASSISLPNLNEAGVPQISPTNAYTGLTRGGRDTQPGDPDGSAQGRHPHLRPHRPDRPRAGPGAGGRDARARLPARAATTRDGEYGRAVALPGAADGTPARARRRAEREDRRGRAALPRAGAPGPARARALRRLHRDRRQRCRRAVRAFRACDAQGATVRRRRRRRACVHAAPGRASRARRHLRAAAVGAPA